MTPGEATSKRKSMEGCVCDATPLFTSMTRKGMGGFGETLPGVRDSCDGV